MSFFHSHLKCCFYFFTSLSTCVISTLDGSLAGYWFSSLCWFWFILQDYASWCCIESQKNARYYHCLLRWLAWMMTFIHNVFFFSVVFLFIYGCCLLYFYQSNVPRGLVILLVHAGWSFVDLFSHHLYYLSKSLETSMVEAGFVLRALDQGCKESTTTFMTLISSFGVLCVRSTL